MGVQVLGLGFGVCGLGVRFEGFGCGVKVWGFRVEVVLERGGVVFLLAVTEGVQGLVERG